MDMAQLSSLLKMAYGAKPMGVFDADPRTKEIECTPISTDIRESPMSTSEKSLVA
jgi:hypothetical protein